MDGPEVPDIKDASRAELGAFTKALFGLRLRLDISSSDLRLAVDGPPRRVFRAFFNGAAIQSSSAMASRSRSRSQASDMLQVCLGVSGAEN